MNKTKWKLSVIAATIAMAGCNQKTQVAEAPGHDHKAGEHDGHDHAPAAGEHGGHDHAAAGAHTHATKLQVSAGATNVSGGTSRTAYTLKVLDAQSGQPVKDFETVHDKLMHLIVVSKDLSNFNHLHPDYKGNGVFTVNTKLPAKGGYKIYADYKPKDGENEVAQHDLGSGGSASLVADKVGQGGWIVKNVVAAPEGELVATPQKQLKADAGPLSPNNGPRYQVALMPMPAKPIAGGDIMLHFQVRDAGGKPIKDLQPYLGALGHCVVLSSDTKIYLHSHPMEGGHTEGGDMSHEKQAAPQSGGPDVMFHTKFPKAGLYKTWGQFMHKGKIITASFVLNVAAK